MEFRFNISKIFKNNISRIGNSLLPAGYAAQDRRAALWVYFRFNDYEFLNDLWPIFVTLTICRAVG